MEKEREYIIKQMESDLQEIISRNDLHIDVRNKALSSLMTQLEGLYPKSIDDKESDIHKLYIKISSARNFEHSFYQE